jgi:hypothetical protein
VVDKSSRDEDRWNVGPTIYVPARIPQFPNTLHGQLARAELAEVVASNNEDAFIERLSDRVAEKLARLNSSPLAPAAPPPKPPVPKGRPSYPEWWTYQGFRSDLCRAEHLLREPPDGTGTDDISKQRVAGVLGVHPQTISRAMDYYHLARHWWPPSTWPQDEPQPHLPNIGHAIAAASLVFGSGMLDYVSDGKMDGVIDFCQFLAQHLRL